jgi:hypothetical protein
MEVERRPLVVNWGGGTNSTAMLVGLLDRGIRPDLVIFADTGAEKPGTYAFLEEFRAWLAARGLEIVVVQHRTRAGETFEQMLARKADVPAIAYGWKTCSTTWKRDPIDVYTTSWAPFREARAAGRKTWKVVGYDVDERRRAKLTEDERHLYWYPLIEWRWGREECVAAVAAAGLSQPGKSACFFCPSSKTHEILDLRRRHPDLLARALEMEDRARPNLETVKGLGRRFAWREFLEAHDAAACAPRKGQLDMYQDEPEVPCECYDGGPDDEAGAQGEGA